MVLRGRDFLSFADFTTVEIEYLLDLAAELKAKQKRGLAWPLLKGKTLGMIFEKPSTRTRVSFEVGMFQLGGLALYLNQADLQMGRGEPIKDMARVLSRYLDGLLIRTFSQETVVELAEYADIPVINGLTDQFHPTQVLADLLTMRECLGRLQGIKLAYLGDGNNVAHSLLLAGAVMGLEVGIASPRGYQPDPQIVALAVARGGRIKISSSPQEIASQAQVLYTDVWASMGQEKEALKRKEVFKNYQINEDIVRLAAPEVIVLHCLPAKRGEEITSQVLAGPYSQVFNQAENRLHAHKAILAALLSGGE
ncbi:MAG TPA: ornithine carbamoyltransferase [Clostridia bacterium]|jgi:ornithine carbamoyltransferase|nr:ornithine carbamoyltransferase [Clostridia bacterium]